MVIAPGVVQTWDGGPGFGLVAKTSGRMKDEVEGCRLPASSLN